jgi:hypothetical protein
MPGPRPAASARCLPTRTCSTSAWLLAAIAARIGARLLPIFNTGVMLFRNGFAGRVAAHWPEFLRLERRFRRKQLPYPCKNAHILEEIVTSLALGTIEPFTWSHLIRELCPSYLEYRGRNVQSPGIVLHAWTSFYPSCAFEFLGKDAALAYASLPQQGAPRARAFGLRSKVRAGRLLLGTAMLRLPSPVVDAWLRVGASRSPAQAHRVEGVRS